MTEQMNLDETFTNLSNQLSTMTKTTKMLQDEVKTIQKLVKTVSRTNRQRKRKVQKEHVLSKELCNFLSLEKQSKLTKASVMKEVSNYIKTMDLQIKEDKRRFLPNKELSKLFGIKKPYNMTFVEINKYVSPHLTN